MKKPFGKLSALTLIGLSIFLVARWKKKQQDEALAEAIREVNIRMPQKKGCNPIEQYYDCSAVTSSFFYTYF